MFKKLINDSRSEEWNITMYAIILVVLFIIVFTPIILIGINMYPELANTLTEEPSTELEKIVEIIASTMSIFEFFIAGTVLEFMRRKTSMKFNVTDGRATKLLFYFCSEMTIYLLLMIVRGVIQCA